MADSLILSCRKAILLVCCMICFSEALAILHHSSGNHFSTLIAIVLFLLTAVKPFLGLWIFVGLVPFLTGFSQLNGFGDISLIFNSIFLAWLPRYLTKNNQPLTAASTLVSFLIVIILLNLGLSIFRMSELPMVSVNWLNWISSFLLVNQAEPLWQISAALVLLKGLVAFVMVEAELTDNKRWYLFSKTIYLQAICIASFSVYQFITFKVAGINYLGLTLPFGDIHTYGSTVVLLFVFLTVSFLNTKNREDMDGYNTIDLASKKNIKLALGLLATIFFILCLLSSSRMTWLVMAIFICFFLSTKLKNKWIVLFIVVASLFISFNANLLAPKLLQSENYSLRRLGTIINFKQILKDDSLIVRYEYWYRTFRMIGEFPLTGIGTGNVYRNMVSYKSKSLGDKWDDENSHNYYLQMAAELGVPWLMLFLILLYLMYRSPKQCKSECNAPGLRKIDLAPFQYCIAAYLLTMLTGHPLLLSNQQFIFWPIVAIISKGNWLLGYKDEKPLQYPRFFKIVGFICLSLYVIGYCINIYKKKPEAIAFTYGFYSKEYWEGTEMRWISGSAEYHLPPERKKLVLKIVAQPFNSMKPDGLNVKISVNDRVVESLHFLNGGSIVRGLNIASQNTNDIKVKFEVDRVFRPFDIGISRDSRLLGVAIGDLTDKHAVPAVNSMLLK